MPNDKGRARFVHWFGDNFQLTAMFNLPNGSTVSISRVEKAGIPYDAPPSYVDWLQAVNTQKRCRYCWAVTRTRADWERHLRHFHAVRISAGEKNQF